MGTERERREQPERPERGQGRRRRRIVVEVYEKLESGRVLLAGTEALEFSGDRRGGTIR